MTSYFEQRMEEILSTPKLTMTKPAKVDGRRALEPIPVGTKKGYIYFATTDDQKKVKIGFTTNTYSRLASLRTGNPEPMHIQEVFNSYKEAEKMVHRRFAKDRIRGEWFKMTYDMEEFWADIWDYQGAHSSGEDGKTYVDNMSDVFIELDHVKKLLDHVDKAWPEGLFYRASRTAARAP